MSKLLTLSVTVSDDASIMDYIGAMVVGMQDFVGRPCVESISVTCHKLDEEGEIKDTVFAATPVEKLYHDEETLFKVHGALKEDGSLTEEQATDAIMRIQNAGILFREHEL